MAFCIRNITNEPSLNVETFPGSTSVIWPSQRTCRTARFYVCSKKKKRGSAVVSLVSEEMSLQKLHIVRRCNVGLKLGRS